MKSFFVLLSLVGLADFKPNGNRVKLSDICGNDEKEQKEIEAILAKLPNATELYENAIKESKLSCFWRLQMKEAMELVNQEEFRTLSAILKKFSDYRDPFHRKEPISYHEKAEGCSASEDVVEFVKGIPSKLNSSYINCITKKKDISKAVGHAQLEKQITSDAERALQVVVSVARVRLAAEQQ